MTIRMTIVLYRLSGVALHPTTSNAHACWRRLGRLLVGAALGLGLFALTACTTLGPDFKPPEDRELTSWDDSLHGLAIAPSPPAKALVATPELAFWWETFNDPALNRLIAAARTDNPQLRIAVLQILESRAVLGIAGSALYPQVQQINASASYVNKNDHEVSNPLTDGSRTTFGAGFNIGWELDFWGRFRRGVESADASFFASVENQRAAQVLINAQVVSLYYSYRVIQARIDIALKNAEIQKRSFDIATELFKSGNASELDLQQAKTQYLSTRASIPLLEQALTQTRNALAVLLGRSPGSLPGLDDDDYQLPQVDCTKVAVLPAHLLLRRPDIRAAVWQVAAQSAQIGIAEADYYPSISLVGSLGWNGSSRSTAGASSLGIGPALSWNIFSYGRIENNVRLQDARLQQLIENYRNLVLQAAAEVDNAAIAVVKSAEQEALLHETVMTAERALQIANTSYQEGYADFQRVLDAQRSLFAQNDRLISARSQNIAAVISLYKGLGGGWSPAQVADMLPERVIETMKQRVDWGALLDDPLPAPGQQPDFVKSGDRSMSEHHE